MGYGESRAASFVDFLRERVATWRSRVDTDGVNAGQPPRGRAVEFPDSTTGRDAWAGHGTPRSSAVTRRSGRIITWLTLATPVSTTSG